jgi:hypothetical protein
MRAFGWTDAADSTSPVLIHSVSVGKEQPLPLPTDVLTALDFQSSAKNV